MCLDPYKNWIQVDPIFEFLKLLLCCDVALSSPILKKVAVWVQRVKKQSFDFLYFFTGSVLCMVQRVYPENLSVIGCFLPEI